MLGRILKAISTYSVNTVGLLAVLLGAGYVGAGLSGALPAGALGTTAPTTLANATGVALPSSGPAGFLVAHPAYVVLAVVGLAALRWGHEFA